MNKLKMILFIVMIVLISLLIALSCSHFISSNIPCKKSLICKECLEWRKSHPIEYYEIKVQHDADSIVEYDRNHPSRLNDR